IKNPNHFGFKIFPSPIHFKVNGTDFGDGTISKKMHIKANSEEVRTITVESTFGANGPSLISRAMEIAKSKSVTVEIKGDLRAGKFLYKKTFPVNLRERINLGK